jgi:hypothetical protein
MPDGDPLPFPSALARALVAIRAAAERDLVTVVHRRRHRRELDALGVRREDVVECLLQLTTKDFRDGPRADHHEPDRDVWVFGPHAKGRQLYVKIAMGRERVETPVRIVVWSFHVARHPMPPPESRR